MKKELNLFEKKLWFSNPYFFAIKCCRPDKFLTMNYTGPINICLKYESCKPSGYKDICIRKFEYVAQTIKEKKYIFKSLKVFSVVKKKARIK